MSDAINATSEPGTVNPEPTPQSAASFDDSELKKYQAIATRKSKELSEFKSLMSESGIEGLDGLKAAIQALDEKRTESEKVSLELEKTRKEVDALRKFQHEARVNELVVGLGAIPTKINKIKVLLKNDVDFAGDSPALKDGGDLKKYLEALKADEPAWFATEAKEGSGSKSASTGSKTPRDIEKLSGSERLKLAAKLRAQKK